MPNEIKDEPTKGKPENPAAATASNEKRGDKYQRILEAAVEVIAEHGFFNARVSDIAQRAGVADGTIYLYFKSKDQILMAAISNAFGTSLGSNRNLAIVFQTELRQSARFLAQFSQHQLKQYFDLIREVVRKGQDQGVFRGDLSDKIVANCFFGSLDEMVTSWLLSERDYSLPGAADAVVDVILGGVETRRPS